MGTFRIHIRHARAHRGAACRNGTIEQEPVEHLAGVDHNRVAHFEASAMATAGYQFSGVNDFFWMMRVEEERIRFDCFVRQTAATGLFPREAFVEDRHTKSGHCQPLSAESAGRTTSDDGNFFHSLKIRSARRPL